MNVRTDNQRASQYLAKARHAEEQAATTPYPDLKESWLKIAAEFRGLARAYEEK